MDRRLRIGEYNLGIPLSLKLKISERYSANIKLMLAWMNRIHKRSYVMAPGAGFEPARGICPTGSQGLPLSPLGHPGAYWNIV